MKDIEYQNLAQAIRDVCTASNLIPMDTQVRVCRYQSFQKVKGKLGEDTFQCIQRCPSPFH